MANDPMLLLFGAAAFGLIMGYVFAFVIWQLLKNFSQNLLTRIITGGISAIVSVIIGESTTTVFPSDTERFGAYLIGVAISFIIFTFAPSMKQYLERVRENKQKEEYDRQQKKDEAYRRDLTYINNNYWELMRHIIIQIQTKRMDVMETFNEWIDIKTIRYLALSDKGCHELLRQFAREFAISGFQFNMELSRLYFKNVTSQDFQGIDQFIKEQLNFEPQNKPSNGKSYIPPCRFHTTYNRIHNTYYDDSFSFENAIGDFLGECGVGISEAIGTDSSRKVTAIDLWLFDKNDMRTSTKVIMSDHAFYDEKLKAKLAPRGKHVLARLGDVIVLETATLTINAEITELKYGSDSSLPPNSFFEQLALELCVLKIE